MKLYVSSLVLMHRDGTVSRPVDEVHPHPAHPNVAKVTAAHLALISSGEEGVEARRDVARALLVIDNDERASYEFPDLEAEKKAREKTDARKDRAARQAEGAAVAAEEKELKARQAALDKRKLALGWTPKKAAEAKGAGDDTKGAALSAKAAGADPAKPEAPAATTGTPGADPAPK